MFIINFTGLDCYKTTSEFIEPMKHTQTNDRVALTGHPNNKTKRNVASLGVEKRKFLTVQRHDNQ